MMGNLSPPPRAPMARTSPLDHQGGLSLWLRGGIFVLALLAAARPDRWGWSAPSLHDVFLDLFAYSIVGDFVVGLLSFAAPIVVFVAVIALLCFDRLVYVPTYRLMRNRFRLSALAAFGLAVVIEGAVAGGFILALRQHARASDPAPSIVIHRSRIRNAAAGLRRFQ